MSRIGLPARRRLARAALLVAPIRHWESKFQQRGDEELLAKSKLLRGRARGGESLNRLLPEAFGLASVAVQRTLGLRPFDVQLAAGVVLHQGGLAELVTGEGKTLVAVLPTYLSALTGKGVHVMTVNDYLAGRDAEWTQPAYQLLGMTVGALQAAMADEERAKQYRQDITYGTAADFGFDFLRDQIQRADQTKNHDPFWRAWDAEPSRHSTEPSHGEGIQRGHHFALVDEADSVFIDEARTPLIIGGPTRRAAPEEQAVYLWADRVAQQLEPKTDFRLNQKTKQIELTEPGKQRVRWSDPPVGRHAPNMHKLKEQVERAVSAHVRFRRDHHYLVRDESIVIIDEYSGRCQPDRQWQDGLHQAIEAKEKMPITVATGHAAQITFQSFFKLYRKLAGMTGTAAENWRELRRVYKLRVVRVPTNQQVIREQWPDLVFPTEATKFDAIVEEVAELIKLGRPVLIGTRSVDKSENLSERFHRAGISHQVLNAKQDEEEARIVARAGCRSQVTIATNMAGRGTDIKLDPGVAEVGGLHVLCTERHEAGRVDRQLAGRAGRQGDAGSCQFYLALDDELLEGLGPAWQSMLISRGRQGGTLNWQRYRFLFLRAQRRVEKRHRRQRVDLMYYEKHRSEVLKDIGANAHVD